MIKLTNFNLVIVLAVPVTTQQSVSKTHLRLVPLVPLKSVEVTRLILVLIRMLDRVVNGIQGEPNTDLCVPRSTSGSEPSVEKLFGLSRKRIPPTSSCVSPV